MNTETAEREIKMSTLMYRVFRRWRGIVVFGLLAALALGGYQGLKLRNGQEGQETSAVSSSSDDLSEPDSSSSGAETYSSLLKKLEKRQKSTREYLDNSILASIDPGHEAQANVSIRVLTEDPDQTAALQKAYEGFLTSGIDWSGLAADMDTKEEYLSELVSFGDEWKESPETPSGLISLTVKHKNTGDAETILKELIRQMENQKTEIAQTAGAHTVSVGTVSTGYFSDPQLEIWLSEQLKGYAEIATDMDRLEAEKDTAKDTFSGETGAAASAAAVVKYALAGFVLGIAAGILLCMIGLVCRRRILSAREWNSTFGLRSLAVIPDKKRRREPLDRLVEKLDGDKKNQAEEEARYRLAVENISRCIRMLQTEPEGQIRTILLTGDISTEELQETAEKLARAEKQGQKEGRTWLCGQNLASDPDTMAKADRSDAVILVEKTEHSRYSAVQEEVEQLLTWKIPILGTITL